MPRHTPLAGEVGEALERVLGSDTFARSGRARDLLRYLVEREQAGEGETLKGYSIALDVFGRDAEFDPSTDSVVRVQARRLRDLLNQYYESEGADETLRIAIPRGSYVPSYSHVARDEPASPDGSPAGFGASGLEKAAAVLSSPVPVAVAPEPMANVVRAPPVERRDLRRVWIAISAVLILLLFVAYRVGFGGSDVFGPGVNREITSAIPTALPTVLVEADPSHDDVDRVAAVLSGALAGFDTIEYIALSHDGTGPAGEDTTAFQFEISQVPGESDVTIALRHVLSARVLVTRKVDPDDAADMIADLLTSVAPASGVIYAFLGNNNLATPLTDCLQQNDYYYRDPTEEQFIRAYECVRKLEEEGLQSPLIYAELASLELQGIVNQFDYAKDFTRDSALEFARRAIQMGPASPYAHRAYGYLLLQLGSDSEGLAWMRKAYELNTFDLSMAASFAYALVLSGEYPEAMPILERAVRASSSHPGWWDYSLFLAAFMLDEKEKAANATLALETTKRAHYLAVRMIVAHRAGDMAKADELRSEIIEEYPVFAANPRKFFIEAQYPEDLTDRLTEAISAAGLVSAS